MTFTVITHVAHNYKDGHYYGYGPYVREMNVWLKYVDELCIVAPLSLKKTSPIDLPYEQNNISFFEVDEFSITSIKNILKTIIILPFLLRDIYSAMKKADHIHLRCPGNMGMLGAVVQVLFPSKKKTAKYAGNWDPNSKQPLTYKIQKWILSNTFLTKNMKVLVYGEWENETKNIVPFYTATYYEKEKEQVEIRSVENEIKFLFVGTLSTGKRPLYAIELVRELRNKGVNVSIDLYGDGDVKEDCSKYIDENDLFYVKLNGNKSKNEVKSALMRSHFLILPSMSEGWPKVVAEAMFWGCIPIVTNVSCLPYMLGDGCRGVVLELDIDKDLKQIQELISRPLEYADMAAQGLEWSRKYTLDLFESDIKKMI